MITLNIPSRIHDYKVNIFENMEVINDFIDVENSVFVVDKNVYRLYGKLFDSVHEQRIFLIDPIEEKKNLYTVVELYGFLLKFKERKKLTLVSFGGGIIQDITGFVASTLYRGIRWVFFPTTLLAQADSCVGSKTSLNFEQFKNTIGTFYPPHCVNICTEFLDTLPEDAIYSGIGEIIKFMLLDDEDSISTEKIAKLVEDIHQDKMYLPALDKTHKIKQSYIKQDEFDMGKRNLFNYGHCFGHALEYSSDYKIPHGIAVTIGMLFANLISLKRNLISVDVFNEIKNKLLLPNIHISLDKTFFSTDKLLDAIRNDKKRVGSELSMIILTSDDFSAEKIDNLTESEFHDGVLTLMTILNFS